MDSIDSRVVERDGIKWLVVVYYDEDASPHEADCYDADAITAWRQGVWQYVGIEVTPAGLPASVDVGVSLWGIEWHYPIHGSTDVTDLDYYCADGECVADLIHEARGRLLDLWNALSKLPLISITA